MQLRFQYQGDCQIYLLRSYHCTKMKFSIKDLVTFTEEILNGELLFFVQCIKIHKFCLMISRLMISNNAQLLQAPKLTFFIFSELLFGCQNGKLGPLSRRQPLTPNVNHRVSTISTRRLKRRSPQPFFKILRKVS